MADKFDVVVAGVEPQPQRIVCALAPSMLTRGVTISVMTQHGHRLVHGTVLTLRNDGHVTVHRDGLLERLGFTFQFTADATLEPAATPEVGAYMHPCGCKDVVCVQLTALQHAQDAQRDYGSISQHRLKCHVHVSGSPDTAPAPAVLSRVTLTTSAQDR